MMLSKPRKVFQQIAVDAIWRGLVFDKCHNQWPRSKPGDVIKKLSPAQRAELEKLTSDEVKNDFLPLP